MEELNKQEIELLRSLQKNSRFDISDLTERLNMSRTSVYDKIKKLENEGYIKEYVAIIDQKKLGLKFTVIVNVSLNSQRIEYVDEFLERISNLNEVMEAYVTGGIFDVVLKVVVKDPEAYNDFVANKLSAIPHISKIQSSFVMRYIKQTSALPF
ncbi:Lrp/AsnC family transcriptional regulator [Chishuiella changwenlii]|uniref:AsnC family transcriptional regulator n=1 Tax=Chishuiella changwenlii TaxID=1434701 RepID=A0A1M6W1Q7_9FLAO|nr:Lrp/AsnC family transcriptional regulator [Chishuiella changwenlii]GGE89254.1 AsnC family transcriptional regulator [Chishuiella changwenlii]SHK87674.1 Lrp/AsnC family transcriptional regulator [Chishuiella changwenlii]